MMNSWLKNLIDEIEATEVTEENGGQPTIKLEAGQHVVGELRDPFLRKVWGLRHQLRRQEQGLLDQKKHTRGDGCLACTELAAITGKTKILNNIFWPSVRHEFGLQAKPTVGIAEDWTVYWEDEDGVQPRIEVVGLSILL